MIPIELWFQILMLLDVTNLITCRCVSRDFDNLCEVLIKMKLKRVVIKVKSKMTKDDPKMFVLFCETEMTLLHLKYHLLTTFLYPDWRWSDESDNIFEQYFITVSDGNSLHLSVREITNPEIQLFGPLTKTIRTVLDSQLHYLPIGEKTECLKLSSASGIIRQKKQ